MTHITVEGSALKIGVDNALAEAIKSGEWGIRVSFVSDNFSSRQEVVLTFMEAAELLAKMTRAMHEVDTITRLSKPFATEAQMGGSPGGPPSWTGGCR